jgi:uncharacterized membrane protein
VCIIFETRLSIGLGSEENSENVKLWIYVICACLCIVFLLCLASSCVPYAASYSGLSMFDCSFSWWRSTNDYYCSWYMSQMTIVMEEGIFMIHVYKIPPDIIFNIKKCKINLVRTTRFWSNPHQACSKTNRGMQNNIKVFWSKKTKGYRQRVKIS